MLNIKWRKSNLFIFPTSVPDYIGGIHVLVKHFVEHDFYKRKSVGFSFLNKICKMSLKDDVILLIAKVIMILLEYIIAFRNCTMYFQNYTSV